jgi:chromosome segregation protein
LIRLSKISMKNFKSFKHLSLPIPEGFTAIVGPNGSGKSNIVDAICFVLGRSSSKSLRAERFSDLIFNGGKKGKPAKEATVSLYLDNGGGEIPDALSEIKISRTVDHTGNSVYRLNGKRTSRTEILDLISQAHIRPDGHNIILQGDITNLIEMSPLERRGIIDEIAGIAEYDDKKRKANRELEKVSDNISKVEAVMGEVRDQLEKLEKEKDDALRHSDLKGRVMVLKATLLRHQNREMGQKLQEIRKGLEEEEAAMGRATRHIEILKTKLEVKKRESEKLSSEIIIKEETEQFSIFREIERVKNEMERHLERMEDLREGIEKIEDLKKTSKEGIEGAKRDIKALEAEDRGLEGECREIDREIAEIKKEVDSRYRTISEQDQVALKHREELVKLREVLDQEHTKLLKLEREKALLEEQLSGKREFFLDLEGEVGERKERLKELKAELEKAQERYSDLQGRVDRSGIETSRLKEEHTDARAALGRVSVRLESKIDAHAKLKARYQALEKISQRRLSFNRAIDSVLQLRDSGEVKGIYGTVSELGRVNPKYSRALEAAAGKGLEFIVVKDEKVAERCIRHLKETRVGRATFLPLSKLNPRPPHPMVKALAEKAVGFAVELVDFKEEYRKAFEVIFRNTVVIKDLAFARKAGFGKARMVTLEGDIVEVSGIMSGGFYKPTGVGFEEVDASKKEVEALEREVAKLQKERDRLRARVEELKTKLEENEALKATGRQELEGLSDRIGHIKELMEEATSYIAKKSLALKEASSELKAKERTLKALEKDVSRQRAETEKLSKEKDALEKELEGSEVQETLRTIKEMEDRILALDRERDAKRNQINLNRSKVEEILLPRIREYEAAVESGSGDRTSIEDSIRGLEDEYAELEGRMKALKEKEEGIKKEIRELKGRRDFALEGARRITEKLEALSENLDRSKRKSEDLRIEMARLETRLEDIQGALKQFEDVETDLEGPVDPVAMEKDITRMELEMEALEPINMRAIEDYEVVKEKVGTYVDRTDRLLKEKDSIERLMAEIESRKYQIFMDVFEKVAQNFAHTFSSLSEGGSAELLLDGENPLEGGLDIKANPPGKKAPSYLEAMSGGEKTLTALSFIFAIQRFQPAPFYVLDEIDVSLDKSNEKKISEMIAESSKRAQFIVVSHKDSLMSSANQLFGVSNEDGISKIIGVELEEVAN